MSAATALQNLDFTMRLLASEGCPHAVNTHPCRFISREAGRGAMLGGGGAYSDTRRRRSALVTTDTELIDIAAPANIGESSRPRKG